MLIESSTGTYSVICRLIHLKSIEERYMDSVVFIVALSRPHPPPQPPTLFSCHTTQSHMMIIWAFFSGHKPIAFAISLPLVWGGGSSASFFRVCLPAFNSVCLPHYFFLSVFLTVSLSVLPLFSVCFLCSQKLHFCLGLNRDPYTSLWQEERCRNVDSASRNVHCRYTQCYSYQAFQEP